MIIDIVLALLVTYGFYTGFNRGLIDTFFDAISIIIGILVAIKLSYVLINFLEKILPNLSPQIVFLIGLVLTFFLVMLIVRFIGKKLEGLFKLVQLNILNKVAGGALKAFLLSTVFSFLILLAGKVNVLPEDTVSQSRTYKLIEPFPRYAEAGFEKIKPYFQEFYAKTQELIDDAKALEQKRSK
jgi:uncharacterized membrane protein required for colicin V production